MINLQRFIDRVQGMTARHQKDFVMPMSDATAMAAEITKLLIDLNTLREEALKERQDDVIRVEFDGGSFK